VAALHGALPPDLRGHVRRGQHDALGAIIRSIFTADDGEQARWRLRDAVEQLERRLPKIAALLEEAEADALAFYAFPCRALAQAALDEPA
jgi:transposase-like protein